MRSEDTGLSTPCDGPLTVDAGRVVGVGVEVLRFAAFTLAARGKMWDAELQASPNLPTCNCHW